MKVVAELRIRRAHLEREIVELKHRANCLWAAWTTGASFEYDGGEDGETVPPCSFWPSTTENESELSVADAIKAYLRPQPRRSVVLPWCVSDSWLAVNEHQAVNPAAQGRCSRCGSCHGLTEWDSTLFGLLFASSWCLACGWSEDRGLLKVSVPDSLFFVIHALFKVLSRRKALLKLVITEIAVLLSRLRLIELEPAIVTSQRSFFTHHGAHPPRKQPQCVLGLLSEMAFQLQAA